MVEGIAANLLTGDSFKVKRDGATFWNIVVTEVNDTETLFTDERGFNCKLHGDTEIEFL